MWGSTVLTLGLLGVLAILLGAVAANGAGSFESATAVVGANACAECHKQEAEAWKGTHHFKTFRDLPRSAAATSIAQKMAIRRIRSESLCLNCHFTVQNKSGTNEPVSGISCESCHSAGRDWIKVHSGYSGKKADTETKAEKEARWKLAEDKGMVRPGALYKLAKNCLGCHVVPNEGLVNKGGHRAGSAFDLVSWSQGEVRHNTWHSKGKENVPANAARKRMLFLVGLGVELETSLRAVGKGTERKIYAFQMARRVDRARNQIAAAAKAAPGVPELAKVVELSHSAALKLNNGPALDAAADGVAQQISALASKYDGSTLAGLDGLIAGPDRFKGTARPARPIN